MEHDPIDTLAQRAKAARKFRGLTQKQAEAQSGVSQSDISKIERGDTERPQGLLALARAYKADPGWLDTGDGPAPWENPVTSADNNPHNVSEASNVEDGPDIRGKGRYPLISWVQAGDWTAICDNFQPSDAEEWPLTHLNLGPCGFVLRVKGPSMTAEGQRYSFPAGMLLFVNPDKDPVSGQFVIVRREREKSATFKRLTSVDGELFLEALNPEWPKRYIPLEPGDEICGVVVDASFGNLP